ncbi:hypothetical protein S100390_v1c08800 [Spiroplasma sp. NBRC 100390]|uniref:hypothetical protein n=1 Tax=unclassified Spiroplasma TaxID=2637901 RepID=UPI0008929C11|nr:MULTISPECIES: hypothetical protein [unclassified Spiroplasma]AOX44216.1 hypothetical protein STU14_v1c08800 [Spiroplasma sp. TU-14]APE13686.1 hypothetical protein S100390_v1c08800 [Spiroplasma sp. NBRC 100390]
MTKFHTIISSLLVFGSLAITLILTTNFIIQSWSYEKWWLVIVKTLEQNIINNKVIIYSIVLIVNFAVSCASISIAFILDPPYRKVIRKEQINKNAIIAFFI